jgi:hypothetical protein
MRSPTRTLESTLKAAFSDLRLLDAAFYEGPTFRMGFDAHVRAWKRAKQREVWVRYHSRPDFAAAYDSRVQAACATPLPPMKGAA